MNIFERAANALDAYWKRIKRRYNYRRMRRLVEENDRALERSLVTNDQRMALEIIKAQAKQPTMEILMDPKTLEFYITDIDRVDGSSGQGIIMDSKKISVINGVYHYNVAMNDFTIDYLDRYLKRIITRKRLRLRHKMEAKIEKSLATILKKTQNHR